jgi:hypothetical protein
MMEFFAGGKSDQAVNLTTYLHLVPRLKISGDMTLLPLYAFKAWTGNTLCVCVCVCVYRIGYTFHMMSKFAGQ